MAKRKRRLIKTLALENTQLFLRSLAEYALETSLLEDNERFREDNDQLICLDLGEQGASLILRFPEQFYGQPTVKVL
jgi:hypothetical protein